LLSLADRLDTWIPFRIVLVVLRRLVAEAEETQNSVAFSAMVVSK
jgi:hypothetical protein